jgi:hypothetical protein
LRASDDPPRREFVNIPEAGDTQEYNLLEFAGTPLGERNSDGFHDSGRQ